VIGLRVSQEGEYEGLDLSEHGEVAYAGFQTVHGYGMGDETVQAAVEEDPFQSGVKK